MSYLEVAATEASRTATQGKGRAERRRRQKRRPKDLNFQIAGIAPGQIQAMDSCLRLHSGTCCAAICSFEPSVWSVLTV